MKIIIVGNGKIGTLLVQELAKEGHDIVVVDNDPDKLYYTQEKMDVAIVVGNGASIEVLREAGAEESDLLLAVTNSDEVNLLTALLAGKVGCPRTVARVRNPEYDREMNLLKTSFGLSRSINPSKTSAREIFRLLQFPSFLTRRTFAQGRAEMVEYSIPAGSVLEGKPLEQVPALLSKRALICTVERGGEVFVPSGSTMLMRGDKISLSTATADLPLLLNKLGIRTETIRKVMVIGGSELAVYLATDLLQAGIQVKVIEQNKERGERLAERLPKLEVVIADGSLQSVLEEEGIADMDAVIPLTGIDEENIMISLYARSIGVRKTVTKVNRMEYLKLVDQTNLDAIVNPQQQTAMEIISYVRGASNAREGSLQTLSTIANGRVECLSFVVPETGDFLNVPIMKLKLKKAILLAGIVRNQNVIIPGGSDCMMRGDTVIVVADPRRMISNLADIFLENGGNA